MTPLLLLLLNGCAVRDLLDLVRDEPTVERNCDERTGWYPDADGDGLGEGTEVYLGCEAPAGWVTNADDIEDTGSTDSGSTDSGSTDSGSADSGNTEDSGGESR